MLSVFSILLSLLLFSELSSRSLVIAVPTMKMADGVTEQDGLGLIPSEEPGIEPALVPPPLFRRSLVLDLKGEDGIPKYVIIPDMRLKGHPSLSRRLPPRTDQSLSQTPSEYSLKMDRRDTDLDMLRCMVGRVYRPCWEV